MSEMAVMVLFPSSSPSASGNPNRFCADPGVQVRWDAMQDETR